MHNNKNTGPGARWKHQIIAYQIFPDEFSSIEEVFFSLNLLALYIFIWWCSGS